MPGDNYPSSDMNRPKEGTEFTNGARFDLHLATDASKRPWIAVDTERKQVDAAYASFPEAAPQTNADIIVLSEISKQVPMAARALEMLDSARQADMDAPDTRFIREDAA